MRRLLLLFLFFFFNDTATTEIYTLSLHDALPIYLAAGRFDLAMGGVTLRPERAVAGVFTRPVAEAGAGVVRSEEHKAQLQSPFYLRLRLLLSKKKKTANAPRVLLYSAVPAPGANH